MPRDHSDEKVLALAVARNLDMAPDRLTLRRSPTGKFSDTYFVEGGPVPMVLRVAPPDDRSRMLFYEPPVSASLLHMDVWAENILADESGRLTGLIDWDRACWGDPEIEFAVLDYCGISEPALWEGYGAVRDRSPEAEVRRLFYRLYEVQKYIVIRRVRGHDPVRADGYRRQCLQLAERPAKIGGLP